MDGRRPRLLQCLPKGHACAARGGVLVMLTITFVLLLSPWPGTAVGQPAATALSGKELQTLWQDLAKADAPQAYQSMWRLVAHSASAASYLDQQLKDLPPPDLKKVH